MPDTRRCLGPPRCRFTTQEGIKQHEPGCPMLLPPPVVRPDLMRYRNPVAVVTGGALDGDHASGADRQEYEMLYGIPAAIGVEIPLTHRVGDYLAQPRNGTPLAAGIVTRTREQAQRALGRIGISPASVVPTRTRPGDQPLPVDDGGPDMQEIVIADIVERRKVGIERYGQGLKAFDGRDNLRDIYEELLDAAIYIRKEIYKRDGQ